MTNSGDEHERIIKDIKPSAFKSRLAYALLGVFLALYASIYGVYAVNSIRPMVGGVSRVFFYSLVIWWIILFFVIIAAKFCWR